MSEPTSVPAALAGERVDRVVAMLSGLSRTDVAELIEAGRVSIGGVPVTVRHRRVEEGELLEVEVEEDHEQRDVPLPSEAVDFTVVYEDEAIIVVDKPAGLVVHPGSAHRDDTLAAGLLHRYPDLKLAAETGAGSPERPGIVHRLDKDTSGLLVVARTPEAYERLSASLADRSMSRRYLALGLGQLSDDRGVIEAPIGRSRRDPTKMAVVRGGREARTRYVVERRFSTPISCTLLACALETGRTHQIRVHLAALGHPVAGDRQYRGTAKALGLERTFLHASDLELTHPTDGTQRSFHSPLPADLTAALARLS